MNRYFFALVILSAFVLFVACGAEPATEVPPTTVPPTAASTVPAARPTATTAAATTGICGPGTTPAYIKEVVLAKDTEGENYNPVEITLEFEPSQETFHAIVTLEGAPDNIELGSTWYLVRAAGYKPDTQVDENVLDIAEGGSRNIDFTLSTTQDTWPPGDYCVEIYAEGNLALSRNFTVVPNTTPSNATSSVLKQVVLAKDTDPGTFAPVNPTAIFQANDPFIHATLEVFEAPANTRFRARWYPPAQEPLDFDLTTDGTRWLDFRLTPAPDGFPTGEYTLEIYVNDELADTRTFVVE